MGWDAAVLLRVLGGLGGRGVDSDASSESFSVIGGSGCWIGGSTSCDADSPDEALVGRWGFARVGGNWDGIGTWIASWAAAVGDAAGGGVGTAIDRVTRLVTISPSSSPLVLE